MKKVDLWLDTPINVSGDGSVYPEVVHIDTTKDGCEYIEDVYGEILFFDEMDSEMKSNVSEYLEQQEDTL